MSTIRVSNFMITYHVDPETDPQEFTDMIVEKLKAIPKSGIGRLFKGAVTGRERSENGTHFHIGVALSGQMDNAIPLKEFQLAGIGGNVTTRHDDKAIRADMLKYVIKGEIVAKAGEQLFLSLEDNKSVLSKKAQDTEARALSRKKIMKALSTRQYGELIAMIEAGTVTDRMIEDAEKLLSRKKEFRTVKQYTEIPITYSDPAWPKDFQAIFNPATREVKINDYRGREFTWNGVRGLWVYGPTGSGKSEGLTLFNKDSDGDIPGVYKYPNNHFFQKAYMGEQIILVDDMNIELFPTPGHFRAVQEGEDMDRKYSSLNIDPRKVVWVVTANVSPEDMWDKYPEEVKAVRRNMLPLRLTTAKYIERGNINFEEDFTPKVMRGSFATAQVSKIDASQLEPLPLQSQQPLAGRRFEEIGLQLKRAREEEKAQEDKPVKKLTMSNTFGYRQEELDNSSSEDY